MLSPFDKILFISLRGDFERRRRMYSQFKELDLKDKFGHDPVWIIANNGRVKVPHEVHYDPSRKVKLEPSEIGCYGSHYQIYLDAVKNGWEKTLILEDDCIFEFGFSDILERLPDFDYINFTHSTFSKSIDYSRDMVVKGIFKGFGFWFTNAYAINLKTARLFVDRLRTQTDSIDTQIAELQKEINALVCIPDMVTQNTRRFPSTITHTNSKRNDNTKRPLKQATGQ